MAQRQESGRALGEARSHLWQAGVWARPGAVAPRPPDARAGAAGALLHLRQTPLAAAPSGCVWSQPSARGGCSTTLRSTDPG